MKIVKGYVIAFILLIIVYGIGMYAIDRKGDEKVNLTYINDITCQVNEKAATGEQPIGENSDYQVIYCDNPEYLATVNEAIIDNCVITDLVVDGHLQGKIIFDEGIRKGEALKKQLMMITTLLFLAMLVIYIGIGFYLYWNVIRPFHTLKHFAVNIAAGNYDMPLRMDRANYFGAFTESFDLMREELSRAKQSEFEADRSKKELVASLSHDIKTPVSTIKAICEVLEVKLSDSEYESRIHTIADKADVIDLLVSDMFHSTLEDLNVLQIKCEECNSQILEQAVEEMNQYDRIIVEEPLQNCLIWCDPLRSIQVIDNIISNAYKYTKGQIRIAYRLEDAFLVMRIKDEGEGVPEEDLARICEKFYRGSNTEGQAGTGLGLYLSKNFMEGMRGYLDCYNEDGFVAELRFSLV